MSVDAAVARDARKLRSVPSGALILIFILAVAGAGLWWHGRDFYALGLDARIDHPDFRILSPGEVVGHGYGIVGTGLMFTNLLYLVRRRLARWPLGPMRVWLDMHVVTGLLGTLLVVFHSAFQLRTPLAILTSASLMTVVLTGVIGRYLYALAPRSVDAELDTTFEGLDALHAGLAGQIRSALEARPITDIGGSAGLIRTLVTMPRWWGESRARKRVVRDVGREVRDRLDDAEQALLRRSISRLTKLTGAEVRTVAASTLLRTWRSLHRLLAIVLLLCVGLHVTVAWFYGYRWLLSE